MTKMLTYPCSDALFGFEQKQGVSNTFLYY